jgi:ActR/RegA family two-component response regulator
MSPPILPPPTRLLAVQVIALAPNEGALKAVEAVKHGASYYLSLPFSVTALMVAHLLIELIWI